MSATKRSMLVALVMTLLTATACSSPPSSGSLGPTGDSSSGPRLFENTEQGASWAQDNGYELMAQQLEDGIITPEEYEVSYEAHVSCREDAGWKYSTAEAVWNPVDRLKLIRQGAAPVTLDPAKETICNEQFDYIDYVFQTTAVPRMDPQLMSAVQLCLNRAEITFSPDATNLPDLVGTDAGGSPNAEKIAGCVTSEANRLYPELPGLSIAF